MRSTLQNQQLTPIGKMKGEIDGEFEAFYLAADQDGLLYMNRNPAYDAHRFDQSNGWETITQAQVDEYKKQLHFIPQKSRGLKP